METKYTGRQVAILTDVHGLLEPLEAILEDIRRRGITEVFSLGDNIGDGPNPAEVVNLLEENGVISIAGNAEEYVRLGLAPFPYVCGDKKKRSLWTLGKLGEQEKGIIRLYPHFIELTLGGQNIGLCHFANDVRWDFGSHSTWTYQGGFDFSRTGRRLDPNAFQQFMITNTKESQEEMEKILERHSMEDPRIRGVLDAKRDPLFKGKTLDFFDAIIQGHVHWKLYDPATEEKRPSFYSIRAAGMAYREDKTDTASYVILKEKENHKGFDLEEVLVTFDREKMIATILNLTNPEDPIRKFACITPEENARLR